MNDVAERKRVDAFHLANHMSQFIVDNKNSQSVEHRWLANYLVHHLDIVRKVHNRVTDVGISEQTRLFRVGEIEAERKRLTAEIDTLEREKSTLQRVTP